MKLALPFLGINGDIFNRVHRCLGIDIEKYLHYLFPNKTFSYINNFKKFDCLRNIKIKVIFVNFHYKILLLFFKKLLLLLFISERYI